MFSWIVKIPDTNVDLKERDTLVSDVLDLGRNLPITAEYPLVLAWDRSPYSCCLFKHDSFSRSYEMVAHMNFFPREVVDQSGDSIGTVALVANVSTKKIYQGRGIMTDFFRLMQTRATLEGHMGILLWSDQGSFYHKMGFRKVGREYHIQLTRDRLVLKNAAASGMKETGRSDICIDETAYVDFTASEIQALFDFRYPVTYSLRRSKEEYRKLLKIPNTYLAHYGRDFKRGFALMNRGSDFFGVIHEWGAPQPSALLELTSSLVDHLGLGEATILMPYSIDPLFLQEIAASSYVKEHDLGFFWSPDSERKVPFNDTRGLFFVWGMDSI